MYIDRECAGSHWWRSQSGGGSGKTVILIIFGVPQNQHKHEREKNV